MPVNLTSLNNYTRDIPDDRRLMTLDSIPDVALFKALENSFNKTSFIAGNKVQQLIKGIVPMSGKAHGENVSMPRGGSSSYDPLLIPLAELIDNASITSQAMDLADGMPGSWGKAVEDSISDMQNISFKELLRFSTIGSGTGRIAKIASAAVMSDGSANTWLKVICDNEYTTFGWDDVQMIQEGMRLECSQTGAAVVANSSQNSTGTQEYRVIDVVYGDRGNAAYGSTSGYFVLDCVTTGNATEAATAWNNDGYFVYRYGAVSDGIGAGYPLPRGLLYMLQDGTLLTEQLETSYFGLARSAHKSLRARIKQGATPGTPEDWDLSDLTDFVMEVKKGSGKGQVDTWLCNDRLGRCIGRRNTAERNVQVMVNSTGSATGQQVSLQGSPESILFNGKRINVITDEAIPNNSLIMLDSRDMFMHQKNSFDFKRLYGDIWGPTKSDRTTNYEAPYGGYMQFSASRCDNMVLVQDLQDNI